MKNSRPQYTKPMIVDLDDPDQLYASGACRAFGSSDPGVCAEGGNPGGQLCNPGWGAHNCKTGNFVGWACWSGSTP